MAARELPDADTRRKLLRYEPDTGKLYWLSRPRELFPDLRSFAVWNSAHAGNEALTVCTYQGYKAGTLMYRAVRAHRVAWALHHGSWPDGEIDHINGDKADNRAINLRLVNRQQNAKNRPRCSNNSSGYKGVSMHSQTQRWTARIMSDKKSYSLGFFDTPEAAHRAYVEASRRLHGEFGRAR